jgi:hypothetical protein
MTEDEVLKAVRWRYRICNYLFRLPIIWMLFGVVQGFLPHVPNWIDWTPDSIHLIALAIFTTGGAMTLAIYRCPVCDHYLSKFRPDKQKCAHCGARVR